MGDQEEDIRVARDIQERFKLNAHGIYVKRSGDLSLNGYRVVKSLDEIPEIIGV